jgi:hypothetical protein
MDGPLFSDYIQFKDFELQVASLNGTKEFNIEWEECNKQVQNQKFITITKYQRASFHNEF